MSFNSNTFWAPDGRIAWNVRVGWLEARMLMSKCVTSGSGSKPACKPEDVFCCPRCSYEEFKDITEARDRMSIEERFFDMKEVPNARAW